MISRQAARPGLAPCGHTAVFGDGPAGLAATAVDVFDGARDSGSALLLVADDAHPALLDPLPGRDDLLAEGRLRLVRTGEAYADRDPARLLTAFDLLLGETLAQGWAGLTVVAENTSLTRGGDGAFADWLAWEQTTSRWQQGNPVVGVCWFDRTALDDDQVDHLTRLHAATHGAPDPAFRLLAVDGGHRLLGDVDAHDVPRLVHLVATAPQAGNVIDISGAGYVHHTAFTALAATGSPRPGSAPVVLAGARAVHRRVRSALGDRAARVDLV